VIRDHHRLYSPSVSIRSILGQEESRSPAKYARRRREMSGRLLSALARDLSQKESEEGYSTMKEPKDTATQMLGRTCFRREWHQR
jgi:hypothetical protein